MIIVKIMGGIGNQLFQYALVMELLHKEATVKVDTSYFNNIPSGDTKRKCIKDLVGIKVAEASENEIEYFRARKSSFTWRCIRKIINRSIYEPIYYDDNQRIQKRILNRKNAYLIGYWQNPQYFEDVIAEVSGRYLEALSKLDHKNKIIADKIQGSQCSVSIHVRGGDYYNSQNVETFGNICSRTYYSEAIAYCRQKFGNCRFFVFTNDLELSHSVLTENEDYIFVQNNEDDGEKDIYLMSLCHHNVIANSSFSWWGAWLNQNKHKIVIAPKRWTNEEKHIEVCPKEWIRL